MSTIPYKSSGRNRHYSSFIQYILTGREDSLDQCDLIKCMFHDEQTRVCYNSNYAGDARNKKIVLRCTDHDRL